MSEDLIKSYFTHQINFITQNKYVAFLCFSFDGIKEERKLESL